MNISTSLDLLTKLVFTQPALWVKAGELESAALTKKIASIPVESPTYVTGLARAGSTLLLEFLASLPSVATHRYCDFPFIFTPYAWNQFTSLFRKNNAATERAHGDRILITPQSPESMEEMIWIAFFKNLHSKTSAPEINADTHNAAFATFYKQHIQKLLLVRAGNRYVAKNNNLTPRIPYLTNLFPDARYVITVREPVAHIASLMRQHAKFSATLKDNPRAVRHMLAQGHHEFGPTRMPIHFGDQATFDSIIHAWESGEEVRGWALYWSYFYEHVFALTHAHKNCLLMRYEDVCTKPQQHLQQLVAHVNLPPDENIIADFSARISAPDYYQANFSADELALIKNITGETAKKFGY